MCVYLKYDGITGDNFKDNWGIHLNEEVYRVRSFNALFNLHPRKVAVSLLGEMSLKND